MSKLINEASISILLKEMFLREKVDLLTGGSVFSTVEMPQYGIPSIRYLDGATGVNLMQYLMELRDVKIAKPAEGNEIKEQDSASSSESGSSFMQWVALCASHDPLPDTIPEEAREIILELRRRVDSVRPNGEEPGCFPPGMLLGATWEPQLVYRVAEAVAREAMAYGIDVLLGTPNTNIHRDPRNGRLFESFSEDPYLSSRMAPEFSKGVQDQGMVADVKHYAANNQETLRVGIDEHISERALREIYLPGFEAAVKEGGVGTVMSAYNSINGVPCAHNHWLLTTVLKEEWGFEGQVVSDWGAVYDQVKALLAGNDMDMPGPRGKQAVYRAVEDGTIPMQRIDDAVTRMLKMILKTPKFNGKKYPVIDNVLSRSAAYDAAVEGITLLKNNGLLPLSRGTKLALFGKLTKRFMESGSGSAQVDTAKFTSLPTEAARYTDTILLDELLADTQVVIITAGACGQEGRDRPAMDFDVQERAMLLEAIAKAKAANKKIVLLMNVSGPVELCDCIDDVDALICLFFPGMEGARATADILFGAVSPSGKLPLTFPKTYRDCPSSINFPGEFGKVMYGEGIFVGYRYYDYKNITPLYPFGFGLSYSSFVIKDAEVSQPAYSNAAAEPLVVTAKVINTGEVAAKEVIQLYVRDIESTLKKPEKELKGFVKVDLQPGEEKTVEMLLTPQSFASYDTALGCWTAEPGIYELLVGNSSRDIATSARVTLTGKNPYGCSLKSTLGYIAANAKACGICREVMGEGFSISKLKSQAIYFANTPLETYLETAVTGLDKGTQAWRDALLTLNVRLEEADG
ncbi:MAG TPA: glycosyl hydrolase [Clostridiales bacterium]|nr:glycosyl hydrolase [Clostridiales bacterium]